MDPPNPIRRSTRVLPLIVLIVLSAILFPASPPRGQAAPERAGATDVDVTEWLVLVCDPYRSRANAGAAVGGTLPEAFNDLRPPAAADKVGEPSPVGVIRLVGGTDQPLTVRLTTRPGGVFYVGWPPAPVRSTEIVWSRLGLSATPPGPRRLFPLDNGHWLTPLRSAGGSYLTSADGSEKFLLYDADLPFPLPLKLDAGAVGDDSVRVTNTGATPLHDLVLYRPPRGGSGWATGGVAEVPPASSGERLKS